MPIPPTYRLLWPAYIYLGIAFDLYGESDSDGPQVLAAALAGDKRDLTLLLSAKTLDDMHEDVKRWMAEEGRKAADEARADRVLGDRTYEV